MPADYVLFLDRKPVGIIEAKREKEGYRLTVAEDQSCENAHAKLKYLNNNPLPFVYESTGILTRFTDYRDPKPRGRNVFSFHKPETFADWIKKGDSLRTRILNLPALDPTGLRPAQIIAIENLEQSFKSNRPKALIQMATGAGKTFTAATFICRLLKFANARRILFLMDTKNLGEQAEQEFMNFQPIDDNRKKHEQIIDPINIDSVTKSEWDSFSVDKAKETIKDHVISSYHIEIDDLDYTPFDARGGRGRMYQLFGKETETLIRELNEVLAA